MIDNRIINLSRLFKDEYGQELKLTQTQQTIFFYIVKKQHNRIGIICPTQYGKSLTIALATIIRAITLPEKFTIVAPTKSKTKIIMDYVISHLFDDPALLQQLKIEGGKLEQLRRERNKEHLTFRRGGEIKILTGEARNRKNVGAALLGHGSKNVIIDDSPLFDDDTYAFIKRMVGGAKDNLIVETGNPIKRNHFYKVMHNNRYYKHIWIDYKTAIEEGRFTEKYIEEMRQEQFFDVFYECKFPENNQIDNEGYQYLFKPEDISKSIQSGKLPDFQPLIEQLQYIRWRVNSQGKIQIEPKEKLKLDGYDSPDFVDAISLTFYKEQYTNKKLLGCDIASGGNLNVIVMRYENKVSILSYDQVKDTMSTTGKIKTIIETEHIPATNVYIDKTGLGLGVYDRLREQDLGVIGVMEQEKPDNDLFLNKRAEMYWRFKEWLLEERPIKPKTTEPIIYTGESLATTYLDY